MKWLGRPSPFHLFTNPSMINRFIFGQGVVFHLNIIILKPLKSLHKAWALLRNAGQIFIWKTQGVPPEDKTAFLMHFDYSPGSERAPDYYKRMFREANERCFASF